MAKARGSLSVAGLMGLVLLIGLGAATLLRPTPGGATAVASVTAFSLLGAILVAVHRDGNCRGFAVGFLVFGWGYVALSSVASIYSVLWINPDGAVLDLLRWADLTRQFPEAAVGDEVEIYENDAFRTAYIVHVNTPVAGPTTFIVHYADGDRSYSSILPGVAVSRHFAVYHHRVGRSIVTLLVASLGGLLGWSLRATRRRDAAVPGANAT